MCVCVCDAQSTLDQELPKHRQLCRLIGGFSAPQQLDWKGHKRWRGEEARHKAGFLFDFGLCGRILESILMAEA